MRRVQEDIFLFFTTFIIIYLCIASQVHSSILGDDRATHRPAYQSSTKTINNFPHVADLAVDGNREMNFSHGLSCSHTEEEWLPWWAVDMGSKYFVKHIYVSNRWFNRDRLHYFRMGLTDIHPLDVRPTWRNIDVCAGLDEQEFYWKRFSCDKAGIFLVITLKERTNFLTLCEVMVYGPQTIEGGWGEWTLWSECSASCGYASKYRTRECDNPVPQNGGECKGDAYHNDTCIYTDCPDECSSGPCGDGGSCVDGLFSYTCECIDGFFGIQCETNANECDSEPCQNNGTCVDNINEYSCGCPDGFTDSNCETNVDDCQSHPCKYGGECKDLVNGFQCDCARGYTGVKCGKDINECDSKPCQNKGKCTDGIGAAICQCEDGFSGDKCETNINECSSTPCLNDGSCIDGVNEYSCNCSAEYSGSHCDIPSIGTPLKLGQESVIGPKTLPLLIGGIVASILCVIALVVAFVKYRLENSSNKDQSDMDPLTSIPPRTQRAPCKIKGQGEVVYIRNKE